MNYSVFLSILRTFKKQKFLFSRITFRLEPALIPALSPGVKDQSILRETSKFEGQVCFYMSVIYDDCVFSLLRALITLYPFQVPHWWESKDQRAGSF